jgi:hypothetical protein
MIGGNETWNKYYFENGSMRAFGGIKKYKFETWIHLTLEDETEVIINPNKVLFAQVKGREHYK